VAATDEGVCAIEFGDEPAELEARLRRQLPAAVIERLDTSTTTRVAAAARRAELPPLALGLPAEARDIAIRARLRRFLGQDLSRRPPSRVAPPRSAWLVASPGSCSGFADVG
jgi:hypothetical protein